MSGRTSLAAILILTAGLSAYRWARSRRDWSGPLDSAAGVVLSCTSKWNGDDGTVYATAYSFTDDVGSPWRNTTTRLRYCLPPGSPLKVVWPHGHPDRARVEPAAPAK